MNSLQDHLADHLALFVANIPPVSGARDLAAVLFDATRRGPLVDVDFVTGLVENLAQLERWPDQQPDPPPARPDHSGRSLSIVRHPQRPAPPR